MKLSNKQFQTLCQDGPQSMADKLNESIVYVFFEDKFYTESQYRALCEKTKLAYDNEYTEEDWIKAKSNDTLTWFYPKK